MATCIAITKAGKPCKIEAVEGNDLCRVHQLAAEKAAQAPSLPLEEPTQETSHEAVLSTDQQEAARLSAAFRNKAAQEENTEGVGQLRTMGGDRVRSTELTESDLPYPVEAHGENFEFYGPMGMGSQIPDGVEIAAYSSEQQFLIKPQMVRNLMFTRPGQNLPKKRLYTIKALHKDGRLVQLPFEAQIQNNAGGDPQDAIGLRRYQRKGITLLIEWETLMPVYCAAWGCFARAASTGSFAGFCTERHAKHTLPNQYKDAAGIAAGIFGQNATTSRTWTT